MTFDAAIFWPAFAAAGMLTEAVYMPAGGGQMPVQVGFVRPEALLLGDMVQVEQTRIEYETSAMPDLAHGESINIGAVAYTVRGEPEKKGDGYFSTAELVMR